MKKIMGIDLSRVNNGAHQMFMENVAKVLVEYQQTITAHPKTKMLTEEFGTDDNTSESPTTEA